ncbi:MAG TPA: GAF domain-containing protein [Ilumatobacteraceae bacterium]|jgi:GAF domain-containing protein
MSTRVDLLRNLAAVADDLGSIQAPVDGRRQLHALCKASRLALDAASVSVARLDGDTLVYEAADGQGGEAIIDTRLPISRGIAGYVARTCQALIIEQVAGDPRFARDIAERVGYVPDSILATPIVDERGDVVGVLSVLDRGRLAGDTLALASAFADQASLLLPHIDLTVRLAPVLFAALADAIDQGDRDLGDALRRAAARLPDETLELAAVLAELRSLNPVARAAAVRLLSEFAHFATTVRRRR